MSKSNQTQTVLITGATSGIGYELASIFAQVHYNLVLVARSEATLADVARHLKKQGAENVTVFPCDLSVQNSAEDVYMEMKNRGIEVDILVNNAGVGEHGLFQETNLKKELAIIQLNIGTLVHLTKLFMHDMLDRNHGRILQLASVASYQPTPLLAVYAATKAFVLSFSDAVINELRNSKVTMTVMIPGPTDTDFFHKAGMDKTRAAHEKLADPKEVAAIAYDALMRGDHHAFGPGAKTQATISAVLPNENVASKARKHMEEKKDK